MNSQNFYKLLKCPYCESSFKVTSFMLFPETKIVKYGILCCVCDEFPIVEGIIYLKKNNQLNNLKSANFIKKYSYDRALLALFEGRKLEKIIFCIFSYIFKKTQIRKKLLIQYILLVLRCFSLSSKEWYTYLIKRPRRITYLLSIAAVGFIGPKEYIIDIGCGIGHFIANFCKLKPLANIIGIDYSFNELFLARYYNNENIIPLICIDINIGIPIKNSCINTIFFNDVYMYIFKKKFVLKDALRCINNHGKIILIHVHTKGFKNLGQGYALNKTEMKLYSNNNSIYYISDLDFIKSILKGDNPEFKNIHKLKFASSEPSYSFYISKQSKRKLNLQILDKFKIMLNNVTIDFTEEEYANIL